MKQFMLACLALATAAALHAQVGNGVLFMTSADYTFPGTTVDSTSTYEFQVVNDLAVAQTVYFSALDAPFSLVDNSPVEIPADDTTTVTLQFQPTSIGSYSGSLEAVGGVFGSATLNFSGEGIQVLLEWTPESLTFDTTAIGGSSYLDVVISNVGDGQAEVSVEDSPSGLFTAEFIDGIAELEPCVVWEGIEYFNYTVHVDLGSDPGNTYWYMYDGYGYTSAGGTYNYEVDGFEVCFPGDGTNGAEVYIQFYNYGSGQDATLELRDGFGNSVQLITLSPSEPYFGEWLTLEIGEAPVLGSSVSIAEGASNVLRVNFNPVNAGPVSEVITLESNSPLTPEFGLECSGVGISELGGTMCDLNLNMANSPYSFVSDLHLGEDCDLYIDANTTVNFNGFNINVDGDFTVDEGVQLNGDGGIIYASGACQFMGSEVSPIHAENLDLIAEGDVVLSSIYWDPESVGTGYYEQDFTDNADGWSWYSPSSSYYPPSDPHLRLHYNYNGSSDWDWHFTSPLFSLDNPGFVSNVSFYLSEFYYSQYDNHTPVLEFSVNGGDWTQDEFVFEEREYNTQYEGTFSIPLAFGNVYSFQFRIRFQDFGGMTTTLDDVKIGMSSTHDYSTSVPTSLLFFNENLEVENSSIGSFVTAGDSTIVTDSFLKSVTLYGDSSRLECLRSDITNDGLAHGIISVGEHSSIYTEHCRFLGCFGGVLNGNGSVSMRNSLITGSQNEGIISNGPVELDFCTIAFNGGTGLLYDGDNFHTMNNSILWGNNIQSFTQIENGSGVMSTSFSTVQGQSGYGVTGSGQFYWGEGVIEADPLFADTDLHLNIYSPCVDGGQPWLMDAHMPYGLGGVRADMGIYGGPDNAYWGGLALPDGASTLQSVQDSPQDQGNTVGLTFSSSFYDNSELVNNVTHYAFWRHFDPTGAPIADVAEGNWELLGEMPSLSLNNYAYQAPTLGNTNAFGDFSSCYFVAAHTADDDTYWISNVMCGESIDNLAPDDPDLNGLVLETGEVQISWTPPTEEDYAYTEIYNDDGFAAEVGNDTLVIDPSVLPGNSYTYIAVNYDVNGNASEPASLTLDIPAGLDIIPLTAGWNLISTDRSPVDASVEAVFAALNPGNLDYITGFDGGVQFYDPDGLAFLNSLTSLTNGHGYWVRVAEDDTLEVSGASLAVNYLPALNAGWNLIGFPNALPAAPADYFASFIAEGTLEYVTGFDGGSTYFDPNGLPFLNSLTALENSLGYWLKVTEAYDPNGMVLAGDEPIAALTSAATAQPNPNFMLVNGTSDLTDAAGEYVDVLAAGRVVGRLPVLEGGYLMTTALFGDDPATPATEGLEIGTLLEFQFRGALANQTIEYTGQMDLRQLALTFGASATTVEVFPNPFADVIQISGEADATGMLSIQLTDAQGRMVAERPATLVAAGAWNVNWSVPTLAPGLYTCTVTMDGKRMTAIPLMHVN